MKGGLLHYVTQVAKSLFYDNTATSSTLGSNVNDAIDAIYARIATAGTGVTPPFLFSRQGNTGLSSYLQVGNVFSNQAGQVIPGNNKIVRMTLTTSQAYNVAQTVQLQLRTGVTTLVDLATGSITLPGDNVTYSTTITFGTPIAIGPNAEIAAYLKTGNGIQNAVLLIYVVPA